MIIKNIFDNTVMELLNDFTNNGYTINLKTIKDEEGVIIITLDEYTKHEYEITIISSETTQKKIVTHLLPVSAIGKLKDELEIKYSISNQWNYNSNIIVKSHKIEYDKIKLEVGITLSDIFDKDEVDWSMVDKGYDEVVTSTLGDSKKIIEILRKYFIGENFAINTI